MTTYIPPSQRVNDSSHTLAYISLISLTYLGLTILAVGFLYFSSYKSVEHGIHAIQLKDGSFIHGSRLTCEIDDTGKKCQMMLNNALLTITSPLRHGPDPSYVFGKWHATYAGNPVACRSSYLTGSYWPHGVTIEDQAVLSASRAEGRPIFRWRSLMLGVYESQAIILGGVLALGIPLFALFVVPFAVRRLTTWPPPFSLTWLNIFAILFTAAVLTIPLIFIFGVSLLELGFVD